MPLPLFIRGPVDGGQKVDPLLSQLGHRPAFLPDVLADGEADLPAFDGHHQRQVPGGKDAELIENPIIRQEMLIVGSFHHPLVENDEPIAGQAMGVGGDGPHHHVEIAQTFLAQVFGQGGSLVPGRLAESRPEGQVFDGVTGQGHLREQDHIGPLSGRPTGIGQDLGRIAIQVAHAGVDLGQSDGHGRVGRVGKVISHTRHDSPFKGCDDTFWRRQPPYLSPWAFLSFLSLPSP